MYLKMIYCKLLYAFHTVVNGYLYRKVKCALFLIWQKKKETRKTSRYQMHINDIHVSCR